MVSPTERLQRQQQAQRQQRLQSNRQLQQEALREGKSVAQIRQEKRVEQARAERQKQIKEAEKKIEKQFEKVDVPAEAEQILKQIPLNSPLRDFAQKKVREIRQQRQKKFQSEIEKLKQQEKQLREEIQEKDLPSRGGTASRLRKLSNKRRELERLKEKENVSFQQATGVASRKARFQEMRTQQSFGAQAQERRLEQAGIDIKKLQSGDIKVEELESKQLEALKREGLVEVRETELTPFQKAFQSGQRQSFAPEREIAPGIVLRDEPLALREGETVQDRLESVGLELRDKTIRLDFSNVETEFQDIQATNIPEFKSELRRDLEKDFRDIGFTRREAEIIAKESEMQGRTLSKKEAQQIIKQKDEDRGFVGRITGFAGRTFEDIKEAPFVSAKPDEELSPAEKKTVKAIEKTRGRIFDIFSPTDFDRGVTAGIETTPSGERVLVNVDKREREKFKSGASKIAGGVAGFAGTTFEAGKGIDLTKSFGSVIGGIKTGETGAVIETEGGKRVLKKEEQIVSDKFRELLSGTTSPFQEGRTLGQQFEITGEAGKEQIVEPIVSTSEKPFEGFVLSIKDVEKTTLAKEFGTTPEEFEQFQEKGIPLRGGFSISQETRAENILARAEEQGVSPQKIVSDELVFGGGIGGGGLELRTQVEQARNERIIMQRLEKEAEGLTDRFQNKVDKGELTPEEAEKQFQEELKKKIEPVAEGLTEKSIERIKKTQEFEIAGISVRKQALASLGFTIATSFAGGFALSRLALTAPRLATGFEVAGFAPAVIELPSLGKAFAKGDSQQLFEAGLQFAGAIAGGVAGAKIGGRRIPVTEIDNAISRALKKSEPIGFDLDAIVKRFDLSDESRRTLQTIADEGFGVRLIRTELSPRTTANAKLIPDVLGYTVEVIGRNNNVVRRFDLGTFLAKQKGKIYSRNIIERAEGKIKEGEGFFFVESLEGTLKGKKFIPKERATFLEETRKTEDITQPEFIGDVGTFKFETEISQTGFQRLRRGKKPVDITRDIDLSRLTKGFLDEGFEERFKTERKLTTPTERAESILSVRDVGADIRKLSDFYVGLTKGSIIKGVTFAEDFGLKKQIIREAREKAPKKPKADELSAQGLQESVLGDLLPSQKQIAKNLEKVIGGGEARALSKGKQIARKVGQKVQRQQIRRQALRKGTAVGEVAGIQTLDFTQTRQRPLFAETQQSRQLLRNLTGTTDFQKIGQRGITGQRDITGVAQAQPQQLLQKQDLLLKTTTDTGIITQITPTITPPGRPRIKLPDFDDDKRRAFVIKNPNEPSHVFVVQKGKEKRITKNPIRKEKAFDLGAYVTDETLSADFRVKKAKGKVSKPEINVPQNYFNIFGFKFRNFKQRKGKIIPLKQGRFIERSNKRLDTPSEVSGITTARFLAQQRRKTQRQRQSQANLNKSIGLGSLFGNTNNKKGKKSKALNKRNNKVNLDIGRTIKGLI